MQPGRVVLAPNCSTVRFVRPATATNDEKGISPGCCLPARSQPPSSVRVRPADRARSLPLSLCLRCRLCRAAQAGGRAAAQATNAGTPVTLGDNSSASHWTIFSALVTLAKEGSGRGANERAEAASNVPESAAGSGDNATDRPGRRSIYTKRKKGGSGRKEATRTPLPKTHFMQLETCSRSKSWAQMWPLEKGS